MGNWSKRSFLLPAVVILLLINIFPFLFSLALAFGRVSLIGGLKIQLGTWQNWATLLSDERFWNAVRVTVTFVAASVVLEYGLGLFLAVLLHRRLPGSGFFRVLFIVPMTLTPIAVGYTWRMLFNESFGPINHLMAMLGLPELPWLSSTGLSLLSLILVDVWHWTPFMMILLLAGLQSLPEEVMEAAHVDGASHWGVFRYITFPMLLPTSLAAVLLRSLEASKIVDEIFIITGGGPGTSSESLTLYAYYAGLQSFDLAYGATIATGMFVGILLVTVIFLWCTRRLQATELW